MSLTAADIRSMINQGENLHIEFKASFQKQVIETVVAFANAKGGKIFIGIDDHAQVIGVSVAQETIQNHINTIKQNTQPNLLVDINEYQIENKSDLVVDVKEYPIKPVAYKNRYYKRVKNSNHLMSLDEISNEHLKTINGSWDFYIDECHNFSDISQKNIDVFIQLVEGNLGKKFRDDPMTVLRKYELIKEGKLTFAAYLLFTSNHSPMTALQIGRFKDPITIIDNIDVNTNLFAQVEKTIDGIKKHLMTEFIITGEPQITVRYDYPLEAIREVVINMIVHRDYRDSGSSIIKIFDNRIEFFNPGKLYDDITIEKLQSGNYSSRTRNRAVANAFKEAGVIEKYGSGIQRIKNECKTHGVKAPIFEEFDHGFRVTLFKEKLDSGVNGAKGGDVGVNAGVNAGVNDVYKFIEQNQSTKATVLAKQFPNVTQRTIERWLKQLKDADKIEFRGSPKTGGYFAK